MEKMVAVKLFQYAKERKKLSMGLNGNMLIKKKK
jgi:hypothetical protein